MNRNYDPRAQFNHELFSEWRSTHGYSQREAALELGVSQSTISNIERNSHRPSVDLVMRICKVTGYEINEWFW